MSEAEDQTDYVSITAELVASYVSNNQTAPADIPALIAAVHRALKDAGSPAASAEPGEPAKPAVPIKKSVQDEFLISLEDGRRYKTLKRHLAGLGMSPDDYRSKWGLPRDYPMVAPSYARRRSELAKAAGLGQLRKKAEPTPEPVSAPEPAKKTRGRKKAAT